MKPTHLLAILGAFSLAATAHAEDLPRRGSLGVALGNTPAGLTVQSTESESAGEVFREGDVLRAVNGVPAGDFISLQRAIHQLPNGEAVSVTVQREGEDVTFDVVTVPTPEAQIDGATVTYGSVVTQSGLRIRTVTMVPQTSALANPNGMPAVFYVQGIPCQSIDLLGGPDHPRGALYRGLLEAGFVVALADKPGVGDSDGTPCLEGGFDVEVEAYTAAAQALAVHPQVDEHRLYAVGVSMGGIQAPHISKTVNLAGIVTWGTGVQPWADYIVTNFRMRTMINPLQPMAVAEPSLTDMREVVIRALVLEQSPEEIRAASPEVYGRFENTFGSIDGFAGRSLKFHREIDDALTAQAWEQFDGNLLALHGEFDWVASEADHRMATALVAGDGQGTASFEILPGVDHGWTAHDTLVASFQAAFAGRPDRQFHERAVEWLTEQASD